MTTVIPIAVLCRTSSRQQAREKTIQSQIQLAKVDLMPKIGKVLPGGIKYVLVPFDAELHSKKNPSFFCDPGNNLESLEKPTPFKKLLELCRKGKVKSIWSYDPDRVFRSQDYKVLGEIMNVLQYHGVSLITPYEVIPPGERMEDIFLRGPREKRKTMRREQLGKIDWARTEGRPSNGQPGFGFKWSKRNHETEKVYEEYQILRWSGALTSGWTENDFPGPLRLVHERFPQGAGDQLIIDALNEAGLNRVYFNYLDRNNYLKRMTNNPTGKFSKTFLIGLLRRDRYRGHTYSEHMPPEFVGVPKDERPPVMPRAKIKMKMPRVFSDAEWKLIKAKRTERAKHNKRSRKQPHLLVKKLYCGVCKRGCKARYKSKKYIPKTTKIPTSTTPTRYYIHKNTKCKESYRPGRELDDVVWRAVKKELLNNATLQGLLHLAGQGISSDSSLEVLEKSITDCHRTLQQKIIERDNIIALRTSPNKKTRLSQNDYDRQILRVEGQEKEVELSIKKFQRELKLRRKAKRAAKRIDSKLLEKHLDALEFDDRQTVFRALVEKVVESPEGLPQRRKVEIYFKI